MTPRVSVVVPTYGRPDQAKRALAGLLACEVPSGGREIIMVDDGSPVDVAGALGELPDGVRVIRQENAGPAAARNAGINAARGSLVAFTDDDTFVSVSWLIELVAAMEGRQEIAGIGGSIVPRTPGFLAEFIQLDRFVNHSVSDDGTVRYLVTANVLYRREVLVSIGGFSTDFRRASGEDVDLSIRILAAGWNLGVTDGAVVEHEHRTSLRELARTSFRHGSGRYEVARRHPDTVGSTVPSNVARHLSQRYSQFRDGGVKRSVAVFYTALHVLVMLCILAGVMAERVSRRRRR